MRDSRRTQCCVPTLNHNMLDGEREEQIGFANYIVIKKIRNASAEGIGVEDPSAIRNRYSKLVFFVALAMKRDEIKIIRISQYKQWTGCGHEQWHWGVQ